VGETHAKKYKSQYRFIMAFINVVYTPELLKQQLLDYRITIT